MTKNFLTVFLRLRSLRLLCVLVMITAGNVFGQNRIFTPAAVDAQPCTEPSSQSSATHTFRRLGEMIKIQINIPDCDAVALELHWSNGRNNGSNFSVTYLDTSDRPIYTKQFSAFMSGNVEFPFSTFYSQPNWGSRSMISVPSLVIIQAVSPFAYPASLSYRVTRVASRLREPDPAIQPGKDDSAEDGNSTAGKTNGKH